jgi:hypothetical protein
MNSRANAREKPLIVRIDLRRLREPTLRALEADLTNGATLS